MKLCISKVSFLMCLIAKFNIVAPTIPCPSSCLCERNLTESTRGISVECQRKSLRYVPEEFPKNTREIWLEGNMIRTLSHRQVNGLQKLVLIDISFNEITSINEGTFVELPLLEIIDLSENRLRFLPNSMFENCTNVRTIKINRNLIHSFSNRFCQECTHLEKLYLQHNELSILSVDAFTQFDKLKVLDLRGNKFTELSFHGVRFPNSIEELHLGSNAIATAANLKLRNAKNLQILGLEMNFIKDADKLVLENMTRLQFVNLSSNFLTSIPYTSFPLRSIHTLDVSHNQMLSLHNISFVHFDGLRVVYLNDNELHELPKCIFHRNTELTKVHLENNKLKAIAIDRFCQSNTISELFLENNNISKVKISDISSLQLLNLNNNEISDSQLYNIFSLPNITTLLLNSNNLTNLTGNILRNLSSLQKLDLSRNKLIFIGNNLFYNIAKTLKSIDISHNELDILLDSFKELHELERLDLSFNRMTSLPPLIFRGLQKLTILNISHNSIGAVEEAAFDGLTGVVDLDLCDNGIIDLPTRTFSMMKSLVRLDLSENYIKELLEDMFAGLENIKFLNIQNNNIYSINNHPFASLYGLLELNLSNNKLDRIEIDTFRGLSSLIKLDLSRNNIHTLEPTAFQYFVHIESISLSYNKIADFQEILRNCQRTVNEILLDHNLIQNTTGQGHCAWVNTQILDLSYNQIEFTSPETFAIFPKLKYLDLKANFLDEVPTFRHGNYISKLNIANNNIIIVRDLSFENLTELVELDLSEMCFHEIQTYAFCGLKNLELLNLENNCLKNLKRKVIEELPKIRKVRLRRNPWSCDCFLQDFLTIFLEKDRLPILEKPQIICQSPSDFYLQDAFDLSVNDMICKPPVISDVMVSQSAGRLTLMCMAHGIPKPNVSWQDTLGEISKNAQTKIIQTTDGILMVSEIANDAQIGDYICTANNAVGEDTQSIEILQVFNESMENSRDILFVIIVTALIASMVTTTIIICCYFCVNKNRTKMSRSSKYRFKSSKPELRGYENKGRDLQDDYVTIGQHYQKSGSTHDVNMDGKWKDVHKRYLSREDMIEFGQYMAERTMGYGVIRRFNSDHLYLNGHATSAWNSFELNTAVSDSNIDDELGCYTSKTKVTGEYSGPTTPIPLTPLEVAFKYGYKDAFCQEDPIDKMEIHVTDESMVEDFERTFTEKIKEYGDLDKILKIGKHPDIVTDEDEKTATGSSKSSTFGQAHDKLDVRVEPCQECEDNDGLASTDVVLHKPEHVSVIGKDPVDTGTSGIHSANVCKSQAPVELLSDNTIYVSDNYSIKGKSITSSTMQTKGYLNEHYRAVSDDSSDVTSLWDNISLDIDRLDIDRLDVIEAEFEHSMATLDTNSQCDSDEFSF